MDPPAPLFPKRPSNVSVAIPPMMIIPMLAVAGSLVGKKIVPPSSGTFPTDGALFVGLLVGVILIMGGLTFFPALALGPVVEHFAMLNGTFY